MYLIYIKIYIELDCFLINGCLSKTNTHITIVNEVIYFVLHEYNYVFRINSANDNNALSASSHQMFLQ